MSGHWMGTYTGVVAVGGWGFIAAAAEGASSLCSEEGSQPMSRREGARWRLHAARDGLIGLKVEDGRRGIVLTLKKKKKIGTGRFTGSIPVQPLFFPGQLTEPDRNRDRSTVGPARPVFKTMKKTSCYPTPAIIFVSQNSNLINKGKTHMNTL